MIGASPGRRQRAAARPGWRALGLLALAGLGALVGCARMVPPSGGPEDKQAPKVLAHAPDSAAVRVALGAPLRIIFDEPMNRSTVRDWLLVAPWPGKLGCRWDSSSITCWPERGWHENTVYTVVLSTEAVDRRRNRLARALEFAFTTGESLPSGSVAGVVRTRALKAQGVPVCLFPWPPGGLGEAGGRDLKLDPRDALSIAEADAQGRFRLLHVAWGEDFLLGALWDETRNRVYDEDTDLWGFYPAKVQAEALPQAPLDSTVALHDSTAAPPESAAAPGLVGREIYLVYPDEPGDIVGEVSDSACAGFVAPATYRARADSLRRVLSGEIDALGFASQGDSAARVALTPSEEQALRAGIAHIDSLLVGAARDSLRCGGSIWVFAYAEDDSVPAGEASGTGPFTLGGLAPGLYRLEAFRDLDRDGEAGPGEPGGRFPTLIELGPGRRVEGVDFALTAASASGGEPLSPGPGATGDSRGGENAPEEPPR